MLSVCFLLWCLGPQIAPAEQVTFTNDFRHAGRNERIVGYERRFLVGIVGQTWQDGVFAGALPVNVRLLRFLIRAAGSWPTVTGERVELMACGSLPSSCSHHRDITRTSATIIVVDRVNGCSSSER